VQALIKIHIEVFSAGCAARTEVVEMVHRATGPSDEVIVSDMTDIRIATRAKSLGIRSVPSVVIDGKLPDCCARRGPRTASLARILQNRRCPPPWSVEDRAVRYHLPALRTRGH